MRKLSRRRFIRRVEPDGLYRHSGHRPEMSRSIPPLVPGGREAVLAHLAQDSAEIHDRGPIQLHFFDRRATGWRHGNQLREVFVPGEMIVPAFAPRVEKRTVSPVT